MIEEEVRFRFKLSQYRLKLMGLGVPEKKLSPTALSDASGIARATLTKIIEDEDCGHNLGVDGLARLGLLLGIEPNDLIEWRKDAKTPQPDPELIPNNNTFANPGLVDSVVLQRNWYAASLLALGDTVGWLKQTEEPDTKAEMKTDDDGSVRLLLQEGRTMLGRNDPLSEKAPDSLTKMFRLHDDKRILSRSHLLLTFLPEEGLLTAEDLRSSRRTYLRRSPLFVLSELAPGRPVRLQHGDHLYLAGDGDRFAAWHFVVEIQPRSDN